MSECENDYKKPEQHCLSQRADDDAMYLPNFNQKKNPLLFAPQGNKTPQTMPCPQWNPHWDSPALLNMPQLCDLFSHEKTGTAVSPLLAEGFFPIAVFLPSHKWKQGNSLYSADVPQAFFQNVDESFSSLFFSLWWTAFPGILHIFPANAERCGASFLQILTGCRLHHQLPQVVTGQGKSMYKLGLRTKEISCY